jgi:hypothetical protein
MDQPTVGFRVCLFADMLNIIVDLSGRRPVLSPVTKVTKVPSDASASTISSRVSVSVKDAIKLLCVLLCFNLARVLLFPISNALHGFMPPICLAMSYSRASPTTASSRSTAPL